jgi:2-keto-4-pentenoate hydratase
MEQAKILQRITEELMIALDQGEQIEPFSSRFERFSIEDAYLVLCNI